MTFHASNVMLYALQPIFNQDYSTLMLTCLPPQLPQSSRPQASTSPKNVCTHCPPNSTTTWLLGASWNWKDGQRLAWTKYYPQRAIIIPSLRKEHEGRPELRSFPEARDCLDCSHYPCWAYCTIIIIFPSWRLGFIKSDVLTQFFDCLAIEYTAMYMTMVLSRLMMLLNVCFWYHSSGWKMSKMGEG